MKTLRELREARGMSQADLARECGLAQSTVSHLESTWRPPDRDTLCVGPERRAILAAAVGATPEEIAWDGDEWRIAEAARLIARANETGMRGFALKAMPLLMAWLARTRLRQRPDGDDDDDCEMEAEIADANKEEDDDAA